MTKSSKVNRNLIQLDRRVPDSRLAHCLSSSIEDLSQVKDLVRLVTCEVHLATASETGQNGGLGRAPVGGSRRPHGLHLFQPEEAPTQKLPAR